MTQPIQRPNFKPAPAPQRARRMTLGAVVATEDTSPVKLLIYGVEGVGKSSFAAAAPSPVFIPAEEPKLKVARFPRAAEWLDVLDAVEELGTTDHPYRTAVLDSLSAAQDLLWTHVCKRNNWTSIEDAGYGKGYVAAFDEWRVLLAALERLRERKGMNIILTGHAIVRTFQDPDSAVGAYDRYTLALHQGKNSNPGDLFTRWCDAVLFANHEVVKKNSKDRQAISSGLRVMHTERHAAWDAKNRFQLPRVMPFDAEAFWTAIKAGASAEALRTEAEALCARLPNDVATAARAAVAKAGADTRELAQILNRLSAKVAEKETES